jgi:hypothetical protein
MCFVIVKNEFDIRTVHVAETNEGSEFYKEFETVEEAEQYKEGVAHAINESKIAKLKLIQQLISLHNHTTDLLGQNMTKTEEQEA